MHKRIWQSLKILSLLSICTFSFSFFSVQPTPKEAFKFPYAAEGLTDRQAAAHLLNRFAFGPTPGQIEEVVKMGLENWFVQQLEGNLPDDSLAKRLENYDALQLSNAEINRLFPRPVQVLKMAKEAGVILKDSADDLERKEYKKNVNNFVKQNKLRKLSEINRQVINAKILRASYSRNQLREVLADFWFNHFNVSFTKRECAPFLLAYERDAIRKNVTGRFEDLLLSTARSPAMLIYLDNFMSTVSAGDDQAVVEKRLQRRLQQMDKAYDEETIKKFQQKRKGQGLNENYAREVMELHTLGVDGGYSQSDVTQAARVLTGWTLYPMENGYGNALKKMIDKVGEPALEQQGFVHEGDFLFAMNKHDKGEKTVMGKRFSNAGYAEGVELLKLLANHKSTAAFIAKKLAIRFVSDDPPQSLVDKMAKTFLEQNGDIKAVLTTMACAPEFWKASVVRNKTKSAFELTISAVRILNADITQPYQIFGWLDKMGQKVYYYQAPTGFPDKAQYWINTGSLLNRMNFGLAVTSKQIRGVDVNLLALNNGHEPESAAAALNIYGKILLPERDLTTTIRRLTPLITSPAIERKIDIASDSSNKRNVKADKLSTEDIIAEEEMEHTKSTSGDKNINSNKATDYMLAQVVGIIIGSPEFQRK